MAKFIDAVRSMVQNRFVKSYLWAVFMGSSFLGMISFGPLILVLFPITFIVGVAVATPTVGLLMWLLVDRNVTMPLPFVMGSAFVGFLVTISYGIGTHLVEHGLNHGFEWVPSIMLSVPVSLAFGLGGWVFWSGSLSSRNSRKA